jgi:hypothetical protein
MRVSPAAAAYPQPMTGSHSPLWRRLYLLVFRCRWLGRGQDLQIGLYPTRVWKLWLRRGVWPRGEGRPVIFHWWAFGPLQVRRFRELDEAEKAQISQLS